MIGVRIYSTGIATTKLKRGKSTTNNAVMSSMPSFISKTIHFSIALSNLLSVTKLIKLL